MKGHDLKYLFNGAWLAGLAIGAAVACNDAEGICHDDGCDAAIEVAVVDDAGDGGRLRPGEYSFTLGIGWAEKTWTCSVPAEDCALDSFTPFSGPEVNGTLQIRGEAGERGLELLVLEAIGKVRSGPQSFTVTVKRDGVTVAEETFTPQYSDPGGSDGCVVCRTLAGDPPVVHIPE